MLWSALFPRLHWPGNCPWLCGHVCKCAGECGQDVCYFLIGSSWLSSPSSHRCHSSYSQDPRDAPPPTRAETREERMERKVCNVCLLPHVFFFFFASYFRMFPDIRALLSVFSCLPFSWQRREKIERRQQEVETELKMCKSLLFSSLVQACLCFPSPGSPQDSYFGMWAVVSSLY